MSVSAAPASLHMGAEDKASDDDPDSTRLCSPRAKEPILDAARTVRGSWPRGVPRWKLALLHVPWCSALGRSVRFGTWF